MLLPFQIFVEEKGVQRIVAESLGGSFGLLPHRLDCAAALTPGILSYETEAGAHVFVAVDQGVLVKAGDDVMVSVRNAIGGTDLDQLHAAVQRNFIDLDQQEKEFRSTLAHLETGFLHQFMELEHE